MTERTCPGCGAVIVPGPRERNPRRWCSQRCRAWHQRHPDKLRSTTPRYCRRDGCVVELTSRQQKWCSLRCHEIARGVRRLEPLAQLPCVVCGNPFQPRLETQRCCPPPPGKAKSRCGKAYYNAAARGTLERLLTAGRVGVDPFRCATCGDHCEPGVNVAAHASKFCGQACKSVWHRREVEEPARKERNLLASFTTQTPRDIAAYKRAMLADPCSYCGTPSQARDHIVPRTEGGPDDWTNRAGACHSCNSTKQATPLLIFLGWRQARDEFEPWRRIVAAIHTR